VKNTGDEPTKGVFIEFSLIQDGEETENVYDEIRSHGVVPSLWAVSTNRGSKPFAWWRQCSDSLTSQSHVLDLCRLMAHALAADIHARGVRAPPARTMLRLRDSKYAASGLSTGESGASICYPRFPVQVGLPG
jgi:hypothetical protein